VESLREERGSGCASHSRDLIRVHANWFGTSDGIRGERLVSNVPATLTSAKTPGGFGGNGFKSAATSAEAPAGLQPDYFILLQEIEAGSLRRKFFSIACAIASPDTNPQRMQVLA
jgi:hypothetical protein